ncbi:TetR/AcrR family transcriptional regulator [Nocardioides litoris]|uniref:TetR/AcrR family transcriptional regulator n=1 Tax=Nocardioides litoris TaxID=1926648 RepID=UPI0014774AE4|nr:TetR/AcrR family transcriptional regulator [Nocardioides litoris]
MDSLRADGRRSRRAILDAAAATVLEGGDLGYSALARRAGVTRATVYRHFPEPQALLGEVGRELATTFLEPLLARMDAAPVAEAWRQLAELVVSQVDAAATLATEIGSVERLARLAVGDEPITSFLDRRVARGEVTTDLPTAWLAQAVRALCLAALEDHDRPPADRVDLLTAALVRLTSPRG